MITRQQALTGQQFHVVADDRCVLWRRAGRTKTWRTEPGRFEIPVIHGLRDYGRITERHAEDAHLEDECPDAGGAR